MPTLEERIIQAEQQKQKALEKAKTVDNALKVLKARARAKENSQKRKIENRWKYTIGGLVYKYAACKESGLLDLDGAEEYFKQYARALQGIKRVASANLTSPDEAVQ